MSSSERLLIFGATGQLGTDIVKAAGAAHVEHVGLGHEDVEVTNVEAVLAAVDRLRPSVVINSAAFHQVDKCEDDPHQAYTVNAVGALNVARAARSTGARCVYISTDYVFAGDKPPSRSGKLTTETAYTEGDPVGPLNVYGASKAAGEQLVAQTLDNYLIVRVSSLFGIAGARGKGGNFIETILKKAREGGQLRVVNDQWMTPTYTADAAMAIVEVAMRRATGTIHVTNGGACTWHAFASKAVQLAGLKIGVEAVPSTTYSTKVRRPRNSALGTDQLARLLGAPLRGWEDALGAYLRAKGHVA